MAYYQTGSTRQPFRGARTSNYPAHERHASTARPHATASINTGLDRDEGARRRARRAHGLGPEERDAQVGGQQSTGPRPEDERGAA